MFILRCTMNEQDKEFADVIFSDLITGIPHRFIVSEKEFFFYPVTLAMSFQLSRVVQTLEMNQKLLRINPYLEMLRLAAEKKEKCCTILALHTTPNTRLCFFDQKAQRSRKDFFLEHLSVEAVAMLTTFCVTSDKTDFLIKHLGIDKEREKLHEIMKVKDKSGSNSVSVGGRSIFGTLLYQLKSMGYSDEEILYERPYTYLRLMVEDKADSLYLTNEELQNLPKEYGGTLLVADNMDNRADIEKFLKEKGLKING